jgi:hypothetical protein
MDQQLKAANEILANLKSLRAEIAAKSMEFRPDAIDGVNEAIVYVEKFIAANLQYSTSANPDTPAPGLTR